MSKQYHVNTPHGVDVVAEEDVVSYLTDLAKTQISAMEKSEKALSDGNVESFFEYVDIVSNIVAAANQLLGDLKRDGHDPAEVIGKVRESVGA